jgi:hypothetical protein
MQRRLVMERVISFDKGTLAASEYAERAKAGIENPSNPRSYEEINAMLPVLASDWLWEQQAANPDFTVTHRFIDRDANGYISIVIMYDDGK